MTQLCTQCAQKAGIQGDFTGMAKKGEIATVVCEGCGQIDVDHRGLCLTHIHSTYESKEGKNNWLELQKSFLIFLGIMIILAMLLKLKNYVL